jgi:hypothetical protein
MSCFVSSGSVVNFYFNPGVRNKLFDTSFGLLSIISGYCTDYVVLNTKKDMVLFTIISVALLFVWLMTLYEVYHPFLYSWTVPVLPFVKFKGFYESKIAGQPNALVNSLRAFELNAQKSNFLLGVSTAKTTLVMNSNIIKGQC